jgi:hypothetical protein
VTLTSGDVGTLVAVLTAGFAVLIFVIRSLLDRRFATLDERFMPRGEMEARFSALKNEVQLARSPRTADMLAVVTPLFEQRWSQIEARQQNDYERLLSAIKETR